VHLLVIYKRRAKNARYEKLKKKRGSSILITKKNSYVMSGVGPAPPVEGYLGSLIFHLLHVSIYCL
jgi:hypothetical protein